MVVHIKQQLESLNRQEKAELILDALPELKPALEDLRYNSLKYNVLMNRVNGREIDNVLQGNLKVTSYQHYQYTHL